MQDNQSCMLLHENYPFSVVKESKHINVSFFALDKMNGNEVRITCYPTDEIVADFSSKLLQGKLFNVHCIIMLGVSVEDYNLHKQQHEEALEQHILQSELKNNLDKLQKGRSAAIWS